MAFSKIVLTFQNWDVFDGTGTVVSLKLDGMSKNEQAVLIRTGLGKFDNSSSNNVAATNYKNAFNADYAGTGLMLATVAGAVVTITATYDGAVFSDFGSVPDPMVAGEITNDGITVDELEITSDTIEEADTNPCTTVKVVLEVENGTPPYVWNTVLPGNVGLEGTVPRSGGPITIELEDDDGEIAEVTLNIPDTIDNSDILDIGIEGDPSGLFGSVIVTMQANAGIEYEFSLDNVEWQTSNVFTSALVGTYTLYVRDNYGCVISQEFDVTLDAIRPPAYALIPKTNSFGWFEQQAVVNNCTNPYNGDNARPNDYKPQRFYNPRYFQPWCSNDNPQAQFRSNYDTLSAKLIKIVDDSEVTEYDITKLSSNLGNRQIMDARIYQRGPTQTAVYWLSGNLYATDHSTVVGTYALDGQLPEWVRVGQKFSLSGSASDGIFEIKQIIYDSDEGVNAAIIDRVYTDLTEEVLIKVDAVYNKLNYETYQFTANLNDVVEGCYKIVLTMEDSEEEYPTRTFETLPFIVSDSTPDQVILTCANHVDDGIVYGSIIHKQRFTGVFYVEEYPSNYETSRDSRKSLNKLDGRVQKTLRLDVVDVPYWVYEKLALFISKQYITVNGKEVQIEEPFEVERNNTYSRVNLVAQCFVKGYEQYMTNSYDIL